MQIDVWSDVVCPWCYIGKRRLETALKGVDGVEVVWHSFELDPSAPKENTMTLEALLAKKYRLAPAAVKDMQDRVTGLASAEGLTFRLDKARPENTFDAHRLIHWAKTQGLGPAAKERLLQAYFVDGERVGDAAVLARIAGEVGLDPVVAEQILADPTAFADEVRADEAKAGELGIRGVPFFVIDGRYGVSGAQEAAVLKEAITTALGERAPAVNSGDACDDGCQA